MTRRKRGRGQRTRPRASIAVVLARPAAAVAYPGYRQPDLEHRTRTFLTGAALLHAAGIAVLFALASLAPQIQDHILRLQILQPPPEPPPIVEPAPEPPPPPPKRVHVAVPKPAPPIPKPPPEPPAAKPEPPAPKPLPKPAPKPMPKLEPMPALPSAPSVPEPVRAARPALHRPTSVPAPAAQIDRMAARAELPDAVAVAAHRVAAPRAERSAPPPPAAIDRLPVARPEVLAPALPAPRPSPPPASQRAERPAALAPSGAAFEPRPALRGVALSALLPCVSDARELELKQRTVAAARNHSTCESPAGRFSFIETKNVNAFLMRIQQAGGRRSGDRCEELSLALDCLASVPPRSR